MRWLTLLACLTIPLYGAGGEPSVFPTGTTIFIPSEAWESFVLFSSPDSQTHLIDLNGKERHKMVVCRAS